MDKTVGQIIKELREALLPKMSIQALHRESTVSASLLSRIENDHASLSSNTIKKIAPHLKVDVKYLMNIANIIDTGLSSEDPVELQHLLLANTIKHQGKLLNEQHKNGIVQIYNTVISIKDNP